MPCFLPQSATNKRIPDNFSRMRRVQTKVKRKRTIDTRMAITQGDTSGEGRDIRFSFCSRNNDMTIILAKSDAASLPEEDVMQSHSYQTAFTSATALRSLDEEYFESANEFLEEIYGLAKLTDRHLATDRIFDHMDRLLSDGEFRMCDEILRRLDISRISTSVMRSFLAITAAAASHLPSRKALFGTIKAAMSRIKGEELTVRLIGCLV